MSRSRTFSFLGAGVLLLAACGESLVPPESPVAVQLAFTLQPGDAAAGDAIGPVVSVAVQDASGQTVRTASNVVTAALNANPGSGTLSGTVSIAAVQGVATFSDLRVDKAGAGYTLTAVARGLGGATSTSFTIRAGSATHLVFMVQPAKTLGGVVITPPVQAAVQDAFANLATAFQDSVTIALGSNSAPGTLSGTTKVKAVGGIATFGNLSIALASPGYELTAAAAGLTGVTSAPFDITPPATDSLVIAFQSDRGIEAINAEGSERAVLIADHTVSQPAWSPDGAMLAFTRRSANYQTCAINTARADGSDVHQITSTLASFPSPQCSGTPSWSPDGTKIAFAVWGQGVPPGGAIYVVNANGSDARELLVDSQFGYPARPTWSQDGTQLAFECWGGDYTIFICAMNADGTSITDLTSAGGCEWGPAWSPDGSEVAFAGSCEDGGPYTPVGPFGIWLKHADGSSERDLTSVDFGTDYTPAWSPDGTQLVFARGTPADLFIINRDGSGLRQLTSTPDISESFPTWRPVQLPSAGRTHP